MVLLCSPQTSASNFEFGGSSTGVLEVLGATIDNENAKKARVMYDYDADKEDEVSVISDQVNHCYMYIRLQWNPHI